MTETSASDMHPSCQSSLRQCHPQVLFTTEISFQNLRPRFGGSCGQSARTTQCFLAARSAGVDGDEARVARDLKTPQVVLSRGWLRLEAAAGNPARWHQRVARVWKNCRV